MSLVPVRPNQNNWVVVLKDSTRNSLVLYNQRSHELALINDPSEFHFYNTRLIGSSPNDPLPEIYPGILQNDESSSELSSVELSPSSSLDYPTAAPAELIEYYPPEFNDNGHSGFQGPSNHSHSSSSTTIIVCPECGYHIPSPFRRQGTSTHRHHRQHQTRSSHTAMPRQIEAPAIVRDANYFKLLEGFTPVSRNNNSLNLNETNDGTSHESNEETSTSIQQEFKDTSLNQETDQPEEPNAFSNKPSSIKSEYSSISASAFSQGYFDQFFKVKGTLGRGSRGTVYLVEHMLDGYSLGLFALKKVPVGNDHKWLEKVLSEVHLLRLLAHPNLVSYNHMWLENSQISRFAPVVPCAFILQEYCDGGTLEDYVNNLKSDYILESSLPPKDGLSPQNPANVVAKERFRRKSEARSNRQKIPLKKMTKLTLEEILSFSRDIFSGIVHLHGAQVVHRDLKPSNCLLLTPENRAFNNISKNSQFSSASNDFKEDKNKEMENLINSQNSYPSENHSLKKMNKLPTVLVSDFGEGQMEGLLRTGTGTTGTLEYCAPELIRPFSSGELAQFSKKTDMFSLGMILHFLLFSRLPYTPLLIDGADSESLEKLKKEVIDFKGFEVSNVEFREDIPQELYILLAKLLSIDPDERPTAIECLRVIETLIRSSGSTSQTSNRSNSTSSNEPLKKQKQPNSFSNSEKNNGSRINDSNSLVGIVAVSNQISKNKFDDTTYTTNSPHASISFITDRSLADVKTMTNYSTQPFGDLGTPPSSKKLISPRKGSESQSSENISGKEKSHIKQLESQNKLSSKIIEKKDTINTIPHDLKLIDTHSKLQLEKLVNRPFPENFYFGTSINDNISRNLVTYRNLTPPTTNNIIGFSSPKGAEVNFNGKAFGETSFPDKFTDHNQVSQLANFKNSQSDEYDTHNLANSSLKRSISTLKRKYGESLRLTQDNRELYVEQNFPQYFEEGPKTKFQRNLDSNSDTNDHNDGENTMQLELFKRHIGSRVVQFVNSFAWNGSSHNGP
ncbi:uncharacterized protein SAPINGB_P000714 [Magnusiomyces paraingens]|uniref:non-specific serine/threonine protein kinase n=1 Tax=Magnusiomyces paraingens TaxID=2606893 RepID=A0A5E8B2L4_9ASCO|nr:uncharacterized protein SAPINGB_P000714 [Saprochaete ingens]VVT45330.1 unnamed protein product [Saprochaete ingens]